MKYSIITPVYNREDCIDRCINSVIKQLCTNIQIEHIIVDDGSYDRTPMIVQEYADNNPHINYIRLDKNKGTNAARNAAIQAASGDFCILLDSDDYFVDNAIKVINSVVENNLEYKYFMFAPDDKVDEYKAIPILDKKQITISFNDIVINNIFTDFIHVINTDIVKKYPFNEYIRIYEGVFFLRFYREAQKMLFSNIIVTIRERKRNDSVTKDFFQIDKKTIEKSMISLSLKIEWFKDVYLQIAPSKLQQIYLEMLDDLLRLSDYKKAKQILTEIENLNFTTPKRYKVIYNMKLGGLYFLIKKYYLYIRYYVLKDNFN